MGYVMVPVPEEHVEEAMQLILRLTARARLQDWDEASVTELFNGVDEPTRGVLSAVARGTVSGGGVSDLDVAEAIEFSRREVLGMAREANERARQDAHPAMVVIQEDVEVLPNGRTRERRMMSMEPEVAEHVQAAERAELRSSPHHLLSDDG